MATIQLYPKTWALYQQGALNIADEHGILFLNDEYVFDAAHQDYGDIPTEAIVAEASLLTVQSERANNRMMVPDAIAPSVGVEVGDTITAIVLFKQDEYEEDSKLVYYCADATGLPLPTTGVNIHVAFSQGLLVLGAAGYTVPEINIKEASGASTFDNIINADIDNCLMNTNEFGTTITYIHYNNTPKTYVVLKTAIPEEITLKDVDISSISQTIKAQKSKLFYPPRRGDKVIMEGITYRVVGFWIQNYTWDIYLEETIG